MAEPPDPLLLEALTRAAAAPAGLPLLANRAGTGLFAATPAGRKAANACRERGLVRIIRHEIRGKASQEICGITDQGLALLLEQANPRPVLEALVRALESGERDWREMASAVRAGQQQLDALRSVAARVLDRIEPPAHRNGTPKRVEPDLGDAVRAELARWHDSGALGDCPLPELFRRLRAALPALTIGQFHDRLRLLHQGLAVYLHPWTGPLYDLPEPAFALLVGHEIAYYASLRAADPA